MVYRASTLRGLAIAQMVFGSLMIFFGIASIFSAFYWSSHVGFGIWVGFWVFITGILGYIGARDNSVPSKGLIGCFMGFSIMGCVISGVMFICYCVTLGNYSKMKAACEKWYGRDYSHGRQYTYYPSDCYQWYDFDRKTAANVAGLSSCLLLFSLVEFFLALASSIFCCMAMCYGTSPGVVVNTTRTNQQVMYLQPQYMYPGTQPGVIIMQTGAGLVPQGYPGTGQPAVYTTQQPGAVAQPGVAFQQPTYWAVPNPAGAATVPYSAPAPRVQNQVQVQIPTAVKEEDMPPPYSFALRANVPPPASSSGDANPNS